METILNYLSSIVPSYNSGNSELTTETPSFGPSQWKERYGIDVEDPGFPDELEKALEEPCPFNPGKLKKETHLRCLIPPGLKELICDKYALVTKSIDPTPHEAYWILIAKETDSKVSFLTHEEKETELNQRGYRLASVMEAIAAVLAGNHFNVPIYRNLSQFTVCKEVHNGFPLLVGHDRSKRGFTIYTNDWKQMNGAAGVVKVTH